MAEYIPLPSRPHTRQSTTLGDRRFRIDFDFVERLGAWTMSIYTEAGEPIALSRRLVCRQDVLVYAHRDARAPLGVIAVVDETGAAVSPGTHPIDRDRYHLIWQPFGAAA